MPAHLVSIIYNQLITNITLLKALSFTSSILSTMQLIMGSPLFFSLLTSVQHSTQLTTPFSSIVSLPVSASWVPLTTGLSPNSPTGLSQSLPALFLFHITFILWCSPRLYLRSHPFHNLCHSYCFNCILSRCQSTAIC